MNKKSLTVDVSLTAMFAALMVICSWISIPVFGIPISLQSFAVFLGVLVLGIGKSVLSILTYILLGLIGAPVFSGFRGGIGIIFSETGGFIIGFLFAALTCGFLMKLLPDKFEFKLLSMAIGQAVCYISGSIFYAYVFAKDVEIDFVSIISICIVPFIIPDIIKIILAALVSNSVNKSFKQR